MLGGQRHTVVQLSCLYTKQKTQKKKRWHDGRLAVHSSAGRIVLYNANLDVVKSTDAAEKPLDESELPRGRLDAEMISCMRLTELETDNYLVTVEGPWNDSARQKQLLAPSTSLGLVGMKGEARSSGSKGMKNVLRQKFKRPAPWRPPAPCHKVGVQGGVQKKRKPLQPGQLERELYGVQDTPRARPIECERNKLQVSYPPQNTEIYRPRERVRETVASRDRHPFNTTKPPQENGYRYDAAFDELGRNDASTKITRDYGPNRHIHRSRFLDDHRVPLPSHNRQDSIVGSKFVHKDHSPHNDSYQAFSHQQLVDTDRQIQQRNGMHKPAHTKGKKNCNQRGILCEDSTDFDPENYYGEEDDGDSDDQESERVGVEKQNRKYDEESECVHAEDLEEETEAILEPRSSKKTWEGHIPSYLDSESEHHQDKRNLRNERGTNHLEKYHEKGPIGVYSQRRDILSCANSDADANRRTQLHKKNKEIAAKGNNDDDNNSLSQESCYGSDSHERSSTRKNLDLYSCRQKNLQANASSGNSIAEETPPALSKSDLMKIFGAVPGSSSVSVTSKNRALSKCQTGAIMKPDEEGQLGFHGPTRRHSQQLDGKEYERTVSENNEKEQEHPQVSNKGSVFGLTLPSASSSSEVSSSSELDSDDDSSRCSS